MPNTSLTNSDKMLQTILKDEALIEHAGYNPIDYKTINDALNSDCAIVVAIAKFIDGVDCHYTSTEIYNEVSNYLKNNLL